jgi:ABC-type transport system involved in Fe-S cluster assembly fused permease/ATPase subunit
MRPFVVVKPYPLPDDMPCMSQELEPMLPDAFLLQGSEEATSALDTDSERHIQESIGALKGEITVVIIAHRLSTIRNVDHVYVFDRGRLVEDGAYEALRDDGESRFGRLVAAQAL